MNENLLKAKKLVENTDAVFAAVSDSETVSSPMKGIGFIASLCKSGKKLSEYGVADKIVGRAAAFIFVLMEVKEIYAHTLSTGACEIFENYGIEYSFSEKTQIIVNRKGDGMCPMEEAVINCTEPKDALDAVLSTLEKLRSGK